MAEEIGPGSLKCVVVSAGRALGKPVEEALRAHVRTEDVRRLSDTAVLVYTDAPAAEVRDWLAPELRSGESVFVIEFEQWSGHGPAADRRWLLRRGH